jgi:uncharacterized damage-inducible protein DinB
MPFVREFHSAIASQIAGLSLSRFRVLSIISWWPITSGRLRQRIWLGRFTQQPFTAKLDTELYSDFSELRVQRELLDRTIMDWAHNLTPAWLDEQLHYTNSSGVTRTLPHWLLVTHMFNHQTHHRGQLTTLLNQMGYDAGVTDLPAMPEFQGE